VGSYHIAKQSGAIPRLPHADYCKQDRRLKLIVSLTASNVRKKPPFALDDHDICIDMAVEQDVGDGREEIHAKLSRYRYTV
jgi:hypothetical protein